MVLSDTAIQRPVLATVVSLVLGVKRLEQIESIMRAME